MVDPPALAPFAISEDGRTFLGVSTQHFSDGSAAEECFVASFEEPLTSEPLLVVPESCGNHVVDEGEACDDGNANDADACTARCQRVAIGAGPPSTCALHHGAIECWGANAHITGAVEPSDGWSPKAVPETTGAAHFAVGGSHACVVLEGGTVRCWGDNSRGELGDGSTNGSTTPVDVPGLTGVVQVAAGETHSCALVTDGTVHCWGDNSFGQLGDGTLVNSRVPVEASNLTSVVQLSATADYTCA